MAEALIPATLLLMVMVPIVSFVWLFRSVRAGRISKAKGIGLFALYAGLPTFIFIVVFFLLVGIEEMTQISLVSEGLARSFLPVSSIGCGLLVFAVIVFSILMMFVKLKTNAT